MKIKPLFDRVVLKPAKLETQSKNIIITDLTDEKPEVAEVVELGTGGFIDGNEIKFQVKVGNKVIFNKFASSEFTFDNETYILLKQVDIVAIISEK